MNRHTRTPVNAVWFNTVIGILMTLLIFGGELAVGALFSIAAVAAFVAFTIPIFIRVSRLSSVLAWILQNGGYCELEKAGKRDRSKLTQTCIQVFFVGDRFRPGPWNLGRASIPIGVMSCAFVALMVPILLLPSVTGSDLT